MDDASRTVDDVFEVRVRGLRRVEYDLLVDHGLFGEDERIQLLDGELVVLAPQKSPHAGMVESLNERLMPALAGIARVRVQLPLAAWEHSDYWVIDVAGEAVHVHTDPTPQGYVTVTRHGPDEALDACGVTVALGDLGG